MGLFRFKQFSLSDNHCFNKIGTDGILLGAWVGSSGTRVLDIGCGSGLITIMLAQRFPTSLIHGIDINVAAIAEARKNAENTQWQSRLGFSVEDVKTYQPPHTFSSMVANPPFFKDSLRSSKSGRDTARHEDHLTAESLMEFASKYLNPSGTLSLVYPYNRLEECLHAANTNGLFANRQCFVQPKPSKEPNRVLLTFSRHPAINLNSEQLVIRNEDNRFSNDYCSLTKEFYLDF